MKGRAVSHVGNAVSSDKAPKESETTWYTLALSGMHSIPCHLPLQTSGISVAQSFPVALITSYTASCSRGSVRAWSLFKEYAVCGASTKPESDTITVKHCPKGTNIRDTRSSVVSIRVE
nr:hypothetical protein Itr_chr03CG01380 [Ipomoea trifida]